MAHDGEVEAVFRAQRKRLWGMAYRLTGCADDAEDVVQETFARLVAHRPEATSEQIGPWLARVATNLSIDALRRRRRRVYVGPWLPSPTELEGDDLGLASDPAVGAERRYGIAESATYAFLVALEALGPRQRAVVLLRDVLGHTAGETANLIGASEGSVRVLHLRARRALAGYDRARCVPTPELRERHRLVLQQFLECLRAQDVRGLERLLADSVQTVTDSAGEYTALAAPLGGREPVARLYLTAALHRQTAGFRTELKQVNGLPAALITLTGPVRRQAPRTLLRCDLDDRGAIVTVHAILASAKLAALAAT